MLAKGLRAEIDSHLERHAMATGRIKSVCAREAVLGHPDEFDDLYPAEQRFPDNRAGVRDREGTRTTGTF